MDTGSTQVQAWSGTDLWTADLMLLQMDLADAAGWPAFLGECRGSFDVSLLRHPLFRPTKWSRQCRSKPVVAGANAAVSSTSLPGVGFPTPPSCSCLGDRLQIGGSPNKASLPARAITTWSLVSRSQVTQTATLLFHLAQLGWGGGTTTDGEVIVLRTT